MNKVPNDAEQKLHKVLRELGDFMALYEQSEDKLKKQKTDIELGIEKFRTEIQSQINAINDTLIDVKEMMDSAGVARWRIAAEKALKQGEQHLISIKEASNVYRKLAEDSITRLDNVAVSTEKRVNGALSQLNSENSEVVEDFRRRSEEVYFQLEDTTKESIGTLRKLLRWLRFDRITIAVIAGLLAAFLTSSYVNAEWPWETHRQTTQERFLGKRLLAVWPTLPKAKQTEINKILGTKV